MGTLPPVGSVRLIASVLGAAALLALSAPGAALAGTYSWSQPGDFSPSAGANPQQKYGQPAWGYYHGSLLAGLAPLSYDSTLPGWDDSSGDSVQQSGGNLVMQAGANGGNGSSVTVAWNDPFNSSQPITWSYSNSAGTIPCPGFSVTDQNGNSVPSGSPVTGPVYVTASSLLLACSEDIQIQLQTTTPTVTLTAPATGATFTNGQPRFAGTASTAFDASPTVSIPIYSGSSASGSPLETLTAATGSGGAYSAIPTSQLPSGTYTAVAQQDDPIGQTNVSAPVTFTLDNSSPGVTLDSPGSKPLLTSTPTFTGTAGIRSSDAKQATLTIYTGSSVGPTPARQITGSVDSSGHFSIRVSPGLADGAYTAVASQAAGNAVGFSVPLSFRVKVHPPALALGYPGRQATVPGPKAFFFGQAGSALGDSPRVTVELWRGNRVGGKILGKASARAQGPSWSLQWPRRLPYGRYTVRAVQSDDAGHTTFTKGRTFKLVAARPTIRSAVSVTSSNVASLRISCLPRGQGACQGSVLVVTTQSFRTVPGGPAGPLRVMFTDAAIPAGGTAVVSGTVSDDVARVLRSAGGVKVRIAVLLKHARGSTTDAAAQTSLNIGS